MGSTTLATLRTRALDLADMTGSSFPVTARVTNYINEALSELQDALIASNGDYFLSTTTVNLTPGTESYALPTDFQRLKKAWYLENSRRYKVRRWNYEEADAWTLGPVSTGTVELWYNPFVTELSNDNDTVEQILPNGWETYCVYHAAYMLLSREESYETADRMNAAKNAKLQWITDHVTPRDDGDPESVGDYYQRFGEAHIVLPDYRDLRYRIEGSNIRFIELEYTR